MKKSGQEIAAIATNNFDSTNASRLNSRCSFRLNRVKDRGVACRLDICHRVRWNYWRPGREWLDRNRLTSASRPEEWLDVFTSPPTFPRTNDRAFSRMSRRTRARARARAWPFPHLSPSSSGTLSGFIRVSTHTHTRIHTRVPLFLREIRRVNAPANDRSRNNCNFFAIIMTMTSW